MDPGFSFASNLGTLHLVIYFDHNATSPILDSALAEYTSVAREFFGNPSSQHRIGSRADRKLEEARSALASLLGDTSGEIIFTASATESANMFFHHFSRLHSDDARIWISAIEHPCVLEAAKLWFPNRFSLIPLLPSGVVDLEWMNSKIGTEKPKLIAVMNANNETGTIQPIDAILSLAKQTDTPCFIDAVQTIGRTSLPELNAHSVYLSGSAHKFGGPRGAAFLRTPEGSFTPLLVGGPQEARKRAGTENLPAIAAMVTALTEQNQQITSGQASLHEQAKAHFEERIESTLGARVLNKESDRLWNTVSAIMPETGCPGRWVVKLDKKGFAVSTGSACSSGKEAASHVLTAMGVSENEASRVIRISSSWNTKNEEWDALYDALAEVKNELES